jgi:hypothetical protein
MPKHLIIPGTICGTRALKLEKADFEFVGNLDVAAASSEGDKEPQLTLMANTGVPMDLAGFPYPVVVDMKGARFHKNKTPIIADHKTSNRIGHTTEQLILKAGEKSLLGDKKVIGPFIGARGVRSSDMEIAKGIVTDARKGFPFQVSIGAKVLAATFVDEDEEVDVNGKTYEGPIIVATRSSIRELSVTVLGADGNTETIVASRLKKEIDMEFEEFLKDLGLTLEGMTPEIEAKYRQLWKGSEPPKKNAKKGKRLKAQPKDDDDDPPDDEDPPDDDPPASRRVRASNNFDLKEYVTKRRQLDAEEDERRGSIVAVANRFSEAGITKMKIGGKELTFEAARSHAIREGWEADQFELECRRASRVDLEAGGPAIHIVNKEVENEALECAILRQAMMPLNEVNVKSGTKYGLEHIYNEKVLTASEKQQYRINNSIENLYRLQIVAAGKNLGYLRGESNIQAEAHGAWVKAKELKASGFSTINVVQVLENVMHKAAMLGFVATEGVWRQISSVRSLNDFKIHALYRLDYQGHFRKVAPDGELKHLSLVDTKKTIQAETFGAMLTIDRKTRINDDLGLVMSQAQGFGSLGAQRIEEALFVLLLSNPGSFFAAGNGNLLTGAASALGLTSIETAQVSFRNQVINGKPISVAPSILLVGTTNEVLAGRIFSQSNLEVTTTANVPQFANNPFVGRYRPIGSGYLNNTSITDQDGRAISGQSATQWYLIASPNAPQGAALVIGFLNGRQTPFFDQEETQFNIPGGIQMRGYFDFGLAMHITQMALKSAGA